MIFIIFIALLMGTRVEAATYYVSTSGNDSNDGSSANPWRNPQKCTLSGTPVVAGDTCIVQSGTYTNLGDGSVPGSFKGRVVVINSSSPVATAANPITIKSEVPLGAIIEAPDVWPGVDCNVSTCPFTGIYISGGGSYYAIEGFQFTRPGSSQATKAASAGISIASTATNVTIRNNSFHDIARTVCSNSIFGNTGIFGSNQTNILIENNLFYTIGRLRNGESGCVTDKFQHDHGVYLDVSTNAVIRRNVFYDVTRGFAINLKAFTGGTQTTNAKIYHNTFSGDSPTTVPRGQISLVDTFDGLHIANNIFNNPEDGYVVGWGSSLGGSNPAVATGAGITFEDNITNSTRAESSMTNPSLKPVSGITYTNNTMNTSPGFVSAGTNDFRLAAGSAAINAGVSLSGYSYNGAADVGAYETFTAADASITTTTVSVTFGMSLNTPIIPTSGITGWTIDCSASCGTLQIDSVSLKSGTSSVLDITVSGWSGGQCAVGKTITVSFDPTVGAVRDSASIGDTHQRLNALTTFPVTNNCTGVPPPEPPSGSFVYYKLDGNTNDASGSANHGTASGGAWASALHQDGYQCSTGVNCYVESPYMSGVNLSSQSLTISFSVFIPLSDIGLQRTYAGTALGTDQRLHVRTDTGTWRIAIQNYNGSTASNLSVSEGWNRVCLRIDSGTDTVTMYVNGVAGSGSGAVRSYTSFTIASNFRFGLPSGHDVVNAGQGLYDQALIWTSLKSCTDDWTAWNSAASPVTGTLAQVAYRLQTVHLDPSLATINYMPIDTEGEVVSPGGVAIVMQVNCTSSDCTPTALRLHYSLDGVNFLQAVPDLPNSDGIYFWGSSADPTLNRFTAGSALSGALSHTAGPTQLASSATPTVSLATNNSMTLRYIIRGTSGLAGQSVYFKLYRQDGSALSSYAPSSGAKITFINHRGPAGF